MIFNGFVPSRVRYGVSKYGYYAYRYGYGRYGRFGRYGADAYSYGLEQHTGTESPDNERATLNRIKSDTLQITKRLSRSIQKRLTKIFARFRR